MVQPVDLPHRVTSADDGEDTPLTDAEIEAILEQDAAGLPPESHVQPVPVPFARREPGQGRFSRWAIWVVMAFILFGALWQSLR